MVLLLVFVYDRIREFSAARADLAITNGRWLLSVESWMHLNVEMAMNHALSRHQDWELSSSWYYQLMHLSATMVVLVWVYWRHPIAYRPARNALVGINVVALIVFWMLPVAPPRLIPGAGFVDSAVVTNVAEKVTAVTPDLYAAMPSLHVAWATWVALQVLLTTPHRWGRRLAVGHAILTSLAVMATANHYLLDVIAGAVLATAIVHWSRQRLVLDLTCPHVPTPRDGRDPAEAGVVRHEDPCRCGRSGGPAGRRADAGLPGVTRRRRRAGWSKGSAA